MGDKATSQRESWWVLKAQSGSYEALNELFKIFRSRCFAVQETRRLVMAQNVDHPAIVWVRRRRSLISAQRLERSDNPGIR